MNPPTLEGRLGAAGSPNRLPRPADLVQLARPRLAALGLVVVLLTSVAAANEPGSTALGGGRLVLLLVGSGLALCGASALNQVIERDQDGLMRRTERRPLPSGRVTPLGASVYGGAISAIGLLILTQVSSVTAAVAAGGLAAYVLAYTPLKRRSSSSTLVGALPGAAPALMGWTAMTGGVDARGMALFAILFLWQIPHFLAIAWMYRADYARAGFVTLGHADPSGRSTARQAVLACLALLPTSVLPSVLGMTGWLYLVSALALGLYFLRSAARFHAARSGVAARELLRASVLYLPALLVVLVADVLMF